MIDGVTQVKTASLALALVTVAGCYRSYARQAVDDAATDTVLDFAIDPGVDGLEECHDRTFDVSQGHPDVLILMDRSNSMASEFWRPASAAVEDITGIWDGQIAFGFAVFPSTLCSYGAFMCIPTTSVDVPPTLGTSGDISMALSDACCCGGTPLAESLEFVGRYLGSLHDGRPHHVLLVTDGAPNCNPDLDRSTCTCTGDTCSTYDTNSLNCLDDLRAVDAASGLFAAGIPLHVLGISEAALYWSWVMDDLASAGGTGRAVLAEEPGVVHEAMESIAGDVAPCRFELIPGEVVDPADTTFYVDGVPVEWDPTHTNGWDWFNPWTVDFHGPACDLIVEGGVDTVTARINCEA